MCVLADRKISPLLMALVIPQKSRVEAEIDQLVIGVPKIMALEVWQLATISGLIAGRDYPHSLCHATKVSCIL